MFEKCEVNGSGELGIFKYLKSKCPPVDLEFADQNNLNYSPCKSNDIRWNFEKFLINRKGHVVMRINSNVKPLDLAPFIEVLINKGTIEDLKILANAQN